MTEDPRRQRRLRGHAAPVEEEPRELPRIDREAHRLPQDARALAGRGPHRGIIHVEAEVVDRRLDALLERDAELLHLLREASLVDHLVEALADHARGVVVALHELVEIRDRFLLAAGFEPFDEGQPAPHPGRVETPGLAIPRLALARVDGSRRLPFGMQHAVPVGIRLEHVARLLVVEREPVGSGAHRVVGEPLSPVFAVVVRDGLPGQRRREGHGEPVQDLRIGRAQHDLEDVGIDGAHALDGADRCVLLVDRSRGEVRVRLASLHEPGAEVLETLDVGEGLDHGTVHGRVRDAHQLEGDVAREHLPVAATGAGEFEAGILLEEQTGSQLEAVGDAAVAERARRGHRLREARDQAVGAQQIVVLEQGVVHRARDGVGRRRVGHRRIERTRRLVEGGVEDAARRIGVGVGVVAAGDDEPDPEPEPEPEQQHAASRAAASQRPARQGDPTSPGSAPAGSFRTKSSSGNEDCSSTRAKLSSASASTRGKRSDTSKAKGCSDPSGATRSR